MWLLDTGCSSEASWGIATGVGRQFNEDLTLHTLSKMICLDLQISLAPEGLVPNTGALSTDYNKSSHTEGFFFYGFRMTSASFTKG